jgi:hypothetical protein
MELIDIPQICRADLCDIPGILSVLHQNLLVNQTHKNPEFLAKTGFLIHGFTETEAQSAILDRENGIFLVAKKADRVVGYAMGYHTKILKLAAREKLTLVSPSLREILSSGAVFYFRHIARKSGHATVGAWLLEQLLMETKEGGYSHLVCQISHRPFRNQASISFHEKRGFSCVGETPVDDSIFGVYLKKL